jgi:dTDP-4-dehydrorhamnose reductase
MRILILGGDGMLGHQLLRQLAPRHDVSVTLRKELSAYSTVPLFSQNRTFAGIDVRSIEAISACVKAHRSQVIVNAVGLVKQRSNTDDCNLNLELNSLLPHYLAHIAKHAGARLVHFSTDCVFSGRRGGYVETDFPDAEDVYGRTKFLGETPYPHALTLRTSIIGRELSRKAGLLEWFLGQRAMVQGYRKAIYTGFTTLEMARIVERVLLDHPHISGVWHVSSDSIDKYELLCLIRKHFNVGSEIVPDDSFICDRSLNSERFRTAVGYAPPSWDRMIQELARDGAFYQ